MQKNLTFSRAFEAGHPPKDVPAKVLRQIESDAQALAIAIGAGRHKLAYIARCIGKSEGYVSRLRKGERSIPDALVDRLCWATGCNVLRQYRDLQAALDESSERREIERLVAMVRAAA